MEDSYIAYGDFKQKVLLVSQKEINELTDIAFEFIEIKIGKRVISIKFEIKKMENDEDIIEHPPLAKMSPFLEL